MNHSEEQAKLQAEGIAELVAALECDYDRRDQLRADRSDHDGDAAWAVENPDDAAELEDLEKASGGGDCDGRDEARERIYESALEISVRSGWYHPGEEAVQPDEFIILLCTGGPAVRIVGELDEHLLPSEARIEHQDWGTAWTEYADPNVLKDEDLLRYCQQFYFGE